MGAKAINLSDKELDEILASVEDTLSKVDPLAKSLPSQPNGGKPQAMKKDDMPGEKKPEEMDAAPEAAPAADAAPPADAGQEAAAPEAEAPAAEAPGAGAGEEGLEGEAEQPLSDEELAQIYGSMAPEELQRHYMAIRQYLEQSLGGADQGQAAGMAPEAGGAPAPEAPAMKAEDEGKDDKKDQDKKEGMGKSEKTAAPAETDEVKGLKAKIEELEKGIKTAVKAVELVLQPARKSAAGIEFVKKNEDFDGKGPKEDFSNLSKADIDARIKQIGIANLTKSEREAVNSYLLDDASKGKVLDIIKSKGGK